MTESIETDEAIQPHSTTAKVMHWGFMLVFLFALTKQIDELQELEDLALLQYELVFASFFLVLLSIRFVYMQFTRPTALPSGTPRNKKLLARAVHLGMYGCLAMVAITGLAIGGLYWSGSKDSQAMILALVAHELFINSGYVLIILHVAAALYHRRLGDGIWESMMMRWK